MKIDFNIERVEVLIQLASVYMRFYSKDLPKQYPGDLRPGVFNIDCHPEFYQSILDYLGITEFKLIDTRS